MRIRVFQAFASNNSGSYTIVGELAPATAEEVAAELRAVCAEHDAWHEVHAYDKDGESPLDRFAKTHGLTEKTPGREDHWPEHGAAPTIFALGAQVMVHAPYTVTMPKLFGEYFYKRGGRVSVELNHAHQPLVVELAFYVRGALWNDAEAKAKVASFEDVLTPLLPPLIERPDYDKDPVIQPVFHVGDFGTRQLTIIFTDLVSGVEAVRQAAEAHGLSLHVRVSESMGDLVDPLGHLRATIRPWGRARVILWSIGDDRIRAMKAVREIMNVGLDEAKAALADLPTEIVVNVEESYAARAVQALFAAGCDAEWVRGS